MFFKVAQGDMKAHHQTQGPLSQAPLKIDHVPNTSSNSTFERQNTISMKSSDNQQLTPIEGINPTILEGTS